MSKEVSVNDLEAEFYDDENPNEFKTPYFLIANPITFIQHFKQLINVKCLNHHKKARRKLEARIQTIRKATMQTHQEKITREQIGYSFSQPIELVKIPIINQFYTKNTILQGQKNIILLKPLISENKDSHQNCETVTLDDLNLINSLSTGKNDRILLKLNDIFTQALDGSKITTAKYKLEKKETEACLNLLRPALEETLSNYLIKSLETIDKHRNDPYLEYAKRHRIIRKADYVQGAALNCAANASLHNGHLGYNSVAAKLMIHWLDDFVSRTIGHHNLKKSRDGKMKGKANYFLNRDPETFFAIQAIFDQLHEIKQLEHPSPEEDEVVKGRKKNETYHKKDVILAAHKIVEYILSFKISLIKSEEQFCGVINFFKKNVQNLAMYSSKDAIRTAMFAYDLYNYSKEIDYSRLEPKIYSRRWDGNNIIINRKGKGIRRMSQYPFFIKKQTLESELDMVSSITQEHFREYNKIFKQLLNETLLIQELLKT